MSLLRVDGETSGPIDSTCLQSVSLSVGKFIPRKQTFSVVGGKYGGKEREAVSLLQQANVHSCDESHGFKDT